MNMGEESTLGIVVSLDLASSVFEQENGNVQEVKPTVYLRLKEVLVFQVHNRIHNSISPFRIFWIASRVRNDGQQGRLIRARGNRIARHSFGFHNRST
jgi:hypothetical protein